MKTEFNNHIISKETKEGIVSEQSPSSSDVQFNLSEKIINDGLGYDGIIISKDVKEFIRLLKADDVEDLARRMHYAYEQIAKINNWKTQGSCQVDFNNLPEENKKTMLQVATQMICRQMNRIDKLAGKSLVEQNK